MEGTYSAGTIFLQVVPVFKKVQERIADNAKEWDKALGDGLEKSGRQAGERANKAIGEELGKDFDKHGERAGKQYAGHFETSVKGAIRNAQKEIDALDFSKIYNQMRELNKGGADNEWVKSFGRGVDEATRKVEQIKRKLKDLNDLDFTVDFDAKKVLADVALVEGAVRKLLNADHDLEIDANLMKVLGDLETIQKRAEKVAKDKHEIRFGVQADLKQADRAMGSFEKRFRETAQRAADHFGDSFNHKIRQVRGELETLALTEINLDMDSSAAMADLAEVKAYLETVLNDETIHIDVRSDVKGALADIIAFQKAVGAIEPKVDRVSGAFEKKMRAAIQNATASIGDTVNEDLNRIKADLAKLGDAEVGVDINAEAAREEIRRIETSLRRLAVTDVSVDVELAAAAAMGELYAFRQMVNSLDGREIDINVDTDAAGAAAKFGLLNAAMSLFTPTAARAGGAGSQAANSFRSFNFVILAAVVLLPALIPVIAALGAALLALIPIFGAVVGGVGVMLLGFSGIGDAVKALGEVEKNAAKDAEASSQKMRDAAYAVADAQSALADARRSAGQASADAARAVQDAERQAGQASADAARAVADARQAAADAVENAIERQRDAQESYRDAVKEVREAEQDLAEARKRGYEEIDDNKDAIKQNNLDERQGLVDVFDATVRYEAVMADGSSTNLDKEKASIALEQARLRLEEIREEEKRLAAEKKKHDKNGVQGTEAVESAQDALTTALENQRDAQEAVGEAAEAVAQARIDGAEQVADAIRNQQRTEADGARAVADARRNQARTEADGAQQVAKAQENLERAQERYQDALTETEEIGSESMRKLEEAMGKLGPSGRKFARFLYSLRGGFRSLRDTIQENLLPPIQNALGLLITQYGPGFEDWAGRMAAVVGGFFEQMSVDMVFSQSWQDFFAMIDSYGPSMLDTFGDTTLNWMEIFASLITILAPYGERLNEALLGLSESTRDWISSSEGMEDIQRFMDYAFKVGPEVVDFFWNLFRAIAAISHALAPWGEMIMNGLGALFDFIADMDPALLTAIATGVVGIAIAFQLAVGAVALVAAGGAVFASVGAMIVFFGTLAAVAIGYLYQNSETFRNVIDGLFGFLKSNSDILVRLAKWVVAIYVAMRIWRAVSALITAVQIGLTAATYGAAGAAYAQGIAAKAAFVAGRLWAGVLAVVRLHQAGLLLMTIRLNAMFLLAAIRVKAIAVATKVWAAVTKAMIVLQKVMAFASARMFGPWGIALIAVIAIFVLLYKKVDWFRAAVDKSVAFIKKAFEVIVDAAFWVWDQLFGHSIFPDIVDGLIWFFDQVKKIAQWVGEAFMWLYDHFLEPVGKAIYKTFKWLWQNVISRYLKLVIAYWKFVFRAAKAIITKVLLPVMSLVFAVIKKLWQKVVKPYLGLVVAYWKFVFRAIKAVWNTVLKPVLDLLMKVIGLVWTKAVKPTLGWIGEKFETVFRAMKWVWENVLKPVFDAIKDKALPALRRAFNNVVGKIETIWNGLKKIVGKPIEFIVNTVIRDGIVAGFNKVAGFVGSKKIEFDGVDTSSWYATGGIYGRPNAYATGGVLPGYTPGQDVHHFTSPTGGRLHLSGGEAIMRPEVTAALGAGWVDSINGAARAGGVNGVKHALGLDQRYAAGGRVVFPVPNYNGKAPYVRRSSYNLGHDGMDINHPDDTGTGAGGVVPYVAATSGTVTRAGMGDYGNAVVVASPYGSLVYGHGYPGSLLVKPGDYVQPGQVMGRIGTTGNSSAPHLHFGFPGGTFYQAEALLRGAGHVNVTGVKAIKSVKDRFPGWLIDIAKNPVGWAKGLVTKPLTTFNERFDDIGLFGDMITDVPKSIAGKVAAKVWDIIPGPVKKFVGGAAGAFDGAKDFGGEIIHGVGDLGGAVGGFLGGLGGADGASVPAGEGAYRRGGVLPDNGTMMYDNGGYLPPGLTSVVNLTGKPEPVFTSDQFERMGQGGSGQGGFHYEPHFVGSDLTPAEVATDIDRAYRKMKRQGKYGKQG